MNSTRIEFDGEVSGASRRFLIKDQLISQVLVALIITALILTPTLIFGGFQSDITYAVILWCGFYILISAIPFKSVIGVILPQRIFVDLEEGTIVNRLKNREVFGMIDSVKVVEDRGEFYYIKFYVGDRVPCCVCQKNLLTTGTLEQFEALFDGKILRKKRL